MSVDYLLHGTKRAALAAYAPKNGEIAIDAGWINSHCAGGGIREDGVNACLTMFDNYIKDLGSDAERKALWERAGEYKSTVSALFVRYKHKPVSYGNTSDRLSGGDRAAAIFKMLAVTLKHAYACHRKKFDVTRRELDKSRRRLVAFDLDGTLIKNIRFSWKILRDKVGLIGNDNIERKRLFESGKLNYKDWIKIDLKELGDAGLTRELAAAAVEDAKSAGAKLTNNFHEALAALREGGCTVALVSGGVDCVLYGFLENADEVFDQIYINRLVWDDDGALADIIPTRFDGGMHCKGVLGGKEGALIELCSDLDISIADSVFVGDDTNDFGVMEKAGLSIFYYVPELQGAGREPGAAGWPKNMNMICEDDLLVVAKKILKWYEDREKK